MTLHTLPSTNLRIAVSICLATVFSVLLIVAVVLLHTSFDESQITVIRYTGIGLLTMMGFDVTQFSVKRLTFNPDANDTCLVRPDAMQSPSQATRDDFQDPNATLPGVL